MKSSNKLKFDLEIYQRQAEICSALSHPVRLMILDLLQDGNKSCTDILSYIDIPKTNLSQHLSVLRKAQLVDYKKKGLYQFYYLLIPEIKKACSMVKEVLIKQTESASSSQKKLNKNLKRSIK